MPSIRREHAAVGDATVSTLTAGRGEQILLVHGIPSNAELWRPVIGLLAEAGFRVDAPDLPGYGGTRVGATGDSSLAAAADLLARWMHEQDRSRAWVVGHDAGGAVAQIFAVAHPGRVARLTLVDSIADGSWPAPRARFARLAARLGLISVAGRLRLLPNPYLREQIRRGFAQPDSAAAVDEDAVFWNPIFSDAAGLRAFERAVAALDRRDTAEIVDGLRKLDVPCQLVWGMQDVFQRWQVPGRRLQQLLPAPTVSTLDGCGHFVPLECPERFVATLLRWYEEEPA